MKLVIYLIFIISLITCGKIQPKGEIQSKDISLAAFSKLNAKGKFRMIFIQSEQNFINVETYDNIAKNLNIQVKDSTLHITEKHSTENIDFYLLTIYAKNPLKRINISDSIEMNISGELKSEKIGIYLKDNAKFIGAINTKNTEIEMSHKSRANFKGKTKNATLKITDTASIIAPYWFVNVMNINSKKGSYTEINAEDSLKGDIKNTAELHYYGTPINTLKTDKTTKIIPQIFK